MKIQFRFLSLLILIIILAMTACDTGKKDNKNFLLLMLLAGAGENLAVGEEYQGGVIAYILQPGDTGYVAGETHGLIAATADETSGYQWKTSLTSTPGTLTALGTGYANTYSYMTGEEHPAAEAVRNATHGGYNDWFLPSQDELNKLYDNKDSIGGFADDTYWSSSEHPDNDNWALQQYFGNGTQGVYDKYNPALVRAVRAF